MNLLIVAVLLLCAIAVKTAPYNGEFVPKSFYMIDQYGHKSNIVYFRSKRDIDNFPFFKRAKRADQTDGANLDTFINQLSSGNIPNIPVPQNSNGAASFSHSESQNGRGQKVQVRNQAHGPRGASSLSSTYADNQNLQYSSQNRKY